MLNNKGLVCTFLVYPCIQPFLLTQCIHLEKQVHLHQILQDEYEHDRKAGASQLANENSTGSIPENAG